MMVKEPAQEELKPSYVKEKFLVVFVLAGGLNDHIVAEDNITLF